MTYFLEMNYLQVIVINVFKRKVSEWRRWEGGGWDIVCGTTNFLSCQTIKYVKCLTCHKITVITETGHAALNQSCLLTVICQASDFQSGRKQDSKGRQTLSTQ